MRPQTVFVIAVVGLLQTAKALRYAPPRKYALVEHLPPDSHWSILGRAILSSDLLPAGCHGGWVSSRRTDAATRSS